MIKNINPTKTALLLSALLVICMLNIWLFSSAIAYLLGFFTWASEFFTGYPDYTLALKHFHNPLFIIRTWILNPVSAPYLNVRSWWLGLNAVLLFTVVFGYFISKLVQTSVKDLGESTHGSARWASKKDLSQTCDFGFGQGIVVGGIKSLFRVSPVRIPSTLKKWMNKHVLVVGAPGSGKSRGYIRPNIFTTVNSGESFIVTDPKGEICRDLAPWLRSKRYTVKSFNLVNMKLSDSWNPLLEVRTPLDADVFVQVVISMTDAGTSGGDSFWDRAEQNLLKALVLYVTYDKNKERTEKGTVAEIYDLLASGSFKNVDTLFAQLPFDHPAKGPYNTYAIATDNTKGGVVFGLSTRLSVFQQPAVRDITASSKIDLALPGKERCAYFAITPDTHGAFDFLASLFFTFLFVRLIETADANPSGQLEIPVRMLLDEFANIVSIPDFEKKIATARGREISCHVVIQGLPQLERKYGRTWEEIKTCCDTMVVLGVKDGHTAKYVNTMLGRSTVKTYSQTKPSYRPFGFISPDRRENQGTTSRDLLTVDEMLRLPERSCIVFLPYGTPPTFLQVMDYTVFPEYQGVLAEKANKKETMTTEEIDEISKTKGAEPEAIDEKKIKAVEKSESTVNLAPTGETKETAAPSHKAPDQKENIPVKADIPW